MKELWLARDADLQVFGFGEMPNLIDGVWCVPFGSSLIKADDLSTLLGIDITAFNISHEKPIKIRAVWEEIP